MKILFLDSASCAYDTTTYRTRSLGGTQSAVSCLAKALVEDGHDVAVVNGIETPTFADGVQFLSLPVPTPTLNTFDVIILVSATIAQTLRSIGCTKPLILWSHHAADQPHIRNLKDEAERDLYAGVVLVSDWHAQNYITAFRMKHDNVKVIRNAVSPVFLENTPSLNWIRDGRPPVLGYSSTPYRGLDILLLAFPSIRKKLE